MADTPETTEGAEEVPPGELRPMGVPEPPSPSAATPGLETEEAEAAQNPTAKAPSWLHRKRKILVPAAAVVVVALMGAGGYLTMARKATVENRIPEEIASAPQSTGNPGDTEAADSVPAAVAAEAIMDTAVAPLEPAQAATPSSTETTPVPVAAVSDPPANSAEPRPQPEPLPSPTAATKRGKGECVPSFVIRSGRKIAETPSFVKKKRNGEEREHDFTRAMPRAEIHDFSRIRGPCLARL